MKPDDSRTAFEVHDALRTDTWMHSDHYHCQKCGAVIGFVMRLPWEAKHGVTALGTCKRCGTSYTETENAKDEPPKEMKPMEGTWMGFRWFGVDR